MWRMMPLFVLIMTFSVCEFIEAKIENRAEAKVEYAVYENLKNEYNITEAEILKLKKCKQLKLS